MGRCSGVEVGEVREEGPPLLSLEDAGERGSLEEGLDGMLRAVVVCASICSSSRPSYRASPCFFSAGLIADAS